jgi:hypothetical protein
LNDVRTKRADERQHAGDEQRIVIARALQHVMTDAGVDHGADVLTMADGRDVNLVTGPDLRGGKVRELALCPSAGKARNEMKDSKSINSAIV